MLPEVITENTPQTMNEIDNLLALLHSAEDIVVASANWSQCFEPTPIGSDVHSSDAHHDHYICGNNKMTFQTMPGESRHEELPSYPVFPGGEFQQSENQEPLFPIESPRCSSFSDATHHQNSVYDSITTVHLLDSDESERSFISSNINEAHAPETYHQTVSTMDNRSLGSHELVFPPQTKSLLSDQNEPNLILSESRFRSYQVGQWQERFEEVLQFRKAYGHLLVPHSYPPSQKLAQWVKRQRHQHKRKHMGHHSTLSDEREQLLLDAGFVFDSHKAVWYLRFLTLKAFRAANGHCNIPSSFHDSSLQVWMKHQRRQYLLYQKGLKSTLNEERIQLLDSIGLDWNPRNLVKSCPAGPTAS